MSIWRSMGKNHVRKVPPYTYENIRAAKAYDENATPKCVDP